MKLKIPLKRKFALLAPQVIICILIFFNAKSKTLNYNVYIDVALMVLLFCIIIRILFIKNRVIIDYTSKTLIINNVFSIKKILISKDLDLQILKSYFGEKLIISKNRYKYIIQQSDINIDLLEIRNYINQLK